MNDEYADNKKKKIKIFNEKFIRFIRYINITLKAWIKMTKIV